MKVSGASTPLWLRHGCMCSAAARDDGTYDYCGRIRRKSKNFIDIFLLLFILMTFTDYKVKDMSLADRGRKEIMLAEAEMPGLMSLRSEFGQSKPLA